MSNKLKCPFCSEEIVVAHETMCVCTNDKCRAWGCAYPKFILTALISGKKAQDALKVAINALKYVEKHEEDDYPNDVHYRIDLALRRITSITKQEI